MDVVHRITSVLQRRRSRGEGTPPTLQKQRRVFLRRPVEREIFGERRSAEPRRSQNRRYSRRNEALPLLRRRGRRSFRSRNRIARLFREIHAADRLGETLTEQFVFL